MTPIQRKLIIILTLIWGSLVAFLLLSSGAARAGDSFTGDVIPSPFSVSELSITYRDFFPGGRDPLITSNSQANRSLGQELDVNMDFDLFKYGYWNNLIHTKTDKPNYPSVGPAGQFRDVGWEFELGLRATSWLSGGYHHHSQHVLDGYLPTGYPVEDAWEIKLTFMTDHPKAGILSW